MLVALFPVPMIPAIPGRMFALVAGRKPFARQSPKALLGHKCLQYARSREICVLGERRNDKVAREPETSAASEAEMGGAPAQVCFCRSPQLVFAADAFRFARMRRSVPFFPPPGHLMTAPSKTELLIPAGSLDKLKVAVLYGADAVYLGTPDMSLRTKSDFTLEDVLEGVRFAHEHRVRVYLTLNLFAHNKDAEKLDAFIDTIRQVAPDGVIIADPGVFQYVRQRAPEIPLHVSTQANVCSSLAVRFWQSQGASLVVLAREVSFAELTQIIDDSNRDMFEFLLEEGVRPGDFMPIEEDTRGS